MAISGWSTDVPTFYGNQVSYGSGAWYRTVIEVSASSVNASGQATVTWRFGVQSSSSLYDSTNSWSRSTPFGSASGSNLSVQHGSGTITWFSSGSNVTGPGTKSFSGWIQNLADFSGGGARSTASGSVTVSATTPSGISGGPYISNVSTTTFTVSWKAPNYNGGSAVTGYDQEYQTSGGAAVTTSSTVGTAINASGFQPGVGYRVRVRAKNAVGPGPWSGWAYLTTLSGMKVRVGGVWRNAKVWVRVGGTWRQAKVYVRNGGTWKAAK